MAAHGLAFVTGDEAGDVKNVDPALSASITFQVKGFVLVFCLSSERAFSSFCQFSVTQVFFGNLMHQKGRHFLQTYPLRSTSATVVVLMVFIFLGKIALILDL